MGYYTRDLNLSAVGPDAPPNGTGQVANDLYLIAHREVTGKPYLPPRHRASLDDGGLGHRPRLPRELPVGMRVSGGERGRFVHTVLEWTSPFPGESGEGDRQMAHLWALQEWFRGVPVWFSLTTRRWCALAVIGGEYRLVATGSFGELSAVLWLVAA